MAYDDSLAYLPAWQLRDLIVGGELTPLRVTEYFLDRIQRLDPFYHAFITVEPDYALQQARLAEQKLADGGPYGSLFGVPISIKDQLLTKGLRTTAGSLVYKSYVPEEDSLYAERARSAGAIILGKTNTPEFAMSARTNNLLLPECLNPWDRQRTSGGSSGGAAVSVVTGMCPLAIATDGGGSIRMPSAFCGAFGLHPSNGRVPRHGNLGGTLFLTGIGPIASNVRDAAILLQMLAAPDPRDPGCVKQPAPDYLDTLERGVEGVTVGWFSECFAAAGMQPEVLEVARAAALRFAELGAKVEEADIRFDPKALRPAFRVLSETDKYALLGHYYENPETRDLLTEMVRYRFELGRSLTAADYSRALSTRFRLIGEFEGIFKKYDLLMSPATGLIAPHIEDLSTSVVREVLSAYAYVANFSGCTAASVPCGTVNGLPVGLQIIGPPNGESLVFRASRAFERLQPWAERHPELPVASAA